MVAAGRCVQRDGQGTTSTSAGTDSLRLPFGFSVLGLVGCRVWAGVEADARLRRHPVSHGDPLLEDLNALGRAAHASADRHHVERGGLQRIAERCGRLLPGSTKQTCTSMP